MYGTSAFGGHCVQILVQLHLVFIFSKSRSDFIFQVPSQSIGDTSLSGTVFLTPQINHMNTATCSQMTNVNTPLDSCQFGVMLEARRLYNMQLLESFVVLFALKTLFLKKVRVSHHYVDQYIIVPLRCVATK